MKISSCAAALLASFLAFAPGFTSFAKATDLDVANVSANASDEGRLVRMGLGKSIVIHLPADAKDVVVGDAQVVDAVVRSKNTAYLFARKTGQTNIFFFDVNGQPIMNLNLEVSVDVTAIRKLLNRSLPGTHITVDTVNDSVILGGTALNALEAKTAEDLAIKFTGTVGPDSPKVLNTIKIAGEDQVMLQVKVVEVQRDVLKQFGINFRALINAGNFAFDLASINPFSNGLISSGGGYKASFASGSSNFDSLIRAMETDGLVRTLAEPNLTTVSGQPASFLAGGEFPFNYCTGATSTVAATCSIAFKEFGVSLNFTPNVLTEGRISLKIHSDVSELQTVTVGSSSIPSINKRSIDSVLEMPNGGSMMMAGLIRETTRQNASGTPGLKKLPVLGALFRSRDFISNETELVVIVTPHIVRSVAQKQLLTPDQNFAPSSDKQAIFMGRMNKVYGTSGKGPVGSYNGNVGFIVE